MWTAIQISLKRRAACIALYQAVLHIFDVKSIISSMANQAVACPQATSPQYRWELSSGRNTLTQLDTHELQPTQVT